MLRNDEDGIATATNTISNESEYLLSYYWDPSWSEEGYRKLFFGALISAMKQHLYDTRVVRECGACGEEDCIKEVVVEKIVGKLLRSRLKYYLCSACGSEFATAEQIRYNSNHHKLISSLRR